MKSLDYPVPPFDERATRPPAPFAFHFCNARIKLNGRGALTEGGNYEVFGSNYSDMDFDIRTRHGRRGLG